MKMEKQKTKQGEVEKKNLGSSSKKTEEENKGSKSCTDRDCPVHGEIKVRGRTFKGAVIRKFPRRITIEFGRTIYIPKYERQMKKKTRIHARLPDCIKDEINIGDYVEIRECRPLSKIIHFIVIKKIRGGEK